MAFPWDNLITGASTLGAALGAAGLAGRINRRNRADEAQRKDVSDRAERQAASYQAVVVSAAEMQHNYGKRWGKFADLPPAEQRSIRSRGDIVAGELLRALAEVQLRGSEPARQSAEVLRQAALDAEDALEYGGDDEATEDSLRNFVTAIGAFIDAIRQPTAPT